MSCAASGTASAIHTQSLHPAQALCLTHARVGFPPLTSASCPCTPFPSLFLASPAQDIAQKYNVSAMPTFVVIKNGQQVDMMVGASKDKLKELVEKFAA